MRIMKFWVNIIKKIIKVIFNNKIKINILLYFIILILELAMHSSMIIIIRDVSNKSLYIINYILEISVQIGNIIIY